MPCCIHQASEDPATNKVKKHKGENMRSSASRFAALLASRALAAGPGVAEGRWGASLGWNAVRAVGSSSTSSEPKSNRTSAAVAFGAASAAAAGLLAGSITAASADAAPAQKKPCCEKAECKPEAPAGATPETPAAAASSTPPKKGWSKCVHAAHAQLHSQAAWKACALRLHPLHVAKRRACASSAALHRLFYHGNEQVQENPYAHPNPKDTRDHQALPIIPANKSTAPNVPPPCNRDWPVSRSAVPHKPSAAQGPCHSHACSTGAWALVWLRGSHHKHAPLPWRSTKSRHSTCAGPYDRGHHHHL